MSTDYIILAGGCFWGVEHFMARQKGVLETVVGYTGGELDSPTYNEVKWGNTGHAEAVKIVFDPEQTSLKEIVRFFFKIHDPTTPNRQGNDIGTQYRSALFYRDDEQKSIFESVIAEVDESGLFPDPVKTTLEKEQQFYTAEDYHQKYLVKNPGGYNCHFIRS